jgi:uncharacterized protein YpmS
LEEPKDRSKKKPRLKRLLRWLAVDLLVLAILVLLLFYKPGRYHPVLIVSFDPNGEKVHPYLTRELLPKFNNGVQSRRPFRMTIVDNALNEVIARYDLPQASGVSISKPQVLFEPDRIVLMGTANVEGAPLIVTIKLQPQFDEKGLLNLNVEEVKLGAMPITLLVKMVGKEKYNERVAAGDVDTEDIRSQIVASLLSGKLFDPVVTYGGKKVRLKSVEISQGQMEAEFVPAK